MDHSLHGPGGEMRTLSRDPVLREQFVFAMLDGADFADYLQSTYFLDRASLPRALVLWKGDRLGLRSFYTDMPGEVAAGASGIRAFLERVHSGADTGEFEGKAGIPARNWRWLCSYIPAFTLLDTLPRGSFVIPMVLLVLYALYKLITSFPDEDYYDRDAAERRAIQAKKKH